MIIRDRDLMRVLLAIFVVILVLLFVSQPPQINTAYDNSSRQSQRLPIALSIGHGDATISQEIGTQGETQEQPRTCTECGVVIE